MSSASRSEGVKASVCVFEVSGRVYTHSSVLRAAGLCGQWYISLAPADPTGSPPSRSRQSRGRIASKRESKHQTLFCASKQTVPWQKEKEYEINTRGKEPPQPSSSPSVSLQQTEHLQHGEVRTQRADKLSLRSSQLY